MAMIWIALVSQQLYAEHSTQPHGPHFTSIFQFSHSIADNSSEMITTTTTTTTHGPLE